MTIPQDVLEFLNLPVVGFVAAMLWRMKLQIEILERDVKDLIDNMRNITEIKIDRTKI